MSYRHLLVDRTDNVAVVTLNRPDKLNALNRELLEDLDAVTVALTKDESVGAVVLTGAGPKAFAAGADIGEIQALDGSLGKAFAQFGQGVFTRIEDLNKPVVAAVNGFALGGGCELAMACHVRVAASHAKFGQPEVNLGLIPGYGGTQRLPRLIGRGAALHLLLSGEMIDAERALSWGLVSQVVEPEALGETAVKLARVMASKGPLAVRNCLEAVRAGLDMPLEQGLDLEANLFGVCTGSEDMKEGTGAFLEKRKPAFKGR